MYRIIVTERCEQSLAEEESVSQATVNQAEEALKQVHKCGVLHGNVRKDIFLRLGSRVVLVDFAWSTASEQPLKNEDKQRELDEFRADFKADSERTEIVILEKETEGVQCQGRLDYVGQLWLDMLSLLKGCIGTHA